MNAKSDNLVAANFDVFSGVPRDEGPARKTVDKKTLPFDYVDSDDSSENEEIAYDNIGK